MIDWNKVAEIAGGGYGMTFFVLIALSLVVWIVGLIMVRLSRRKKQDEVEAEAENK
jgi:uncharacterized membrane protein